MNERKKIDNSFLKYIEQRDFDKKEVNIDSFLTFKNNRDLFNFLDEFGVDNSNSEDNSYSKSQEKNNSNSINYNNEISKIYHIFSIVPALLISASINFLENVGKDERISKIELNPRVYLSLDEVNAILGIETIHKSFYQPSGRGVKIAILDSGIDKRHPDLTKRVIDRHNLTNEEEEDLCGHGTMMAGLICGTGFVSRIKFRGIAPAAKLIDVKITDRNAVAFVSDLLMGLEAIVEEEIDIILFGMCSPHTTDGNDILSRACSVFSKKNVILIAPAGNFGPDPYTIGTPGCGNNVFCVGAVDKDEKISFFSSRGPSLNGKVKPDLVLPGTRIITAGAMEGILGEKYGNNLTYRQISGTSTSAGIFTGVVAMLKEVRKDLNSEKLEEALKKSCNSIFFSPNSEGNGAPDILKLFKSLDSYIPKPMSYTALLEKSIVFSFGALVSSVILFFITSFLFSMLGLLTI
ncbi:MAG: S8 family serine peptidase [archaeon]|nr:S8 family serine peptidase [archaeon]